MTTGSHALNTIIRHEIDQHGGLISFARFMELALYHPEFGYYNAEKFDIGKQGDFTTASEISPLFAQCLARQCQQIMTQLDTADILELGAGTGRFAGELLLELDKLKSLPKHYYIYEISHRLRDKQKTLLQSRYPSICDRISWIENLPTGFHGVMIANEVLDALPVNCFRIHHQRVEERCVTWENKQFSWKLSNPTSSELQYKVEQLQKNYDFDDGYESEISLDLPTFIQTLTDALNKGVILVSDYGYGQQEYYRPERSMGTLTCFYQHTHHDNPLIQPGFQDITAHVDFTSVIEAAASHGCALAGYTTQAAFLLDCGLMNLVEEQEKNLSPADKVNMHHAVKVLTMPAEMGERIKVMALAKNIELQLRGFHLQDRRREL